MIFIKTLVMDFNSLFILTSRTISCIYYWWYHLVTSFLLYAKESLTTGNNVPLGFKTNKETKKFEIDEIYAPVVKEIFERYAKGDNLYE